MSKAGHDKRQRMREHQDQKIEFSFVNPAFGYRDSAETGFTGTRIDISSHGVGFLTNAPLESGNSIAFKIIEAQDSGIVMWSLKLENKYRVGVRFTDQVNQFPEVLNYMEHRSLPCIQMLHEARQC